ncbi:MAG: transcription elongation factor NusA [Candidatus Altiarchaeales archaeon]|nr:MAG: transcription elongation factor NusA [Candidatus Altiarchaeales archaeon]RLI94382.1 MAG: transcription elongation factor NusA [Candidatus Altiarchaeales archaeon]RLI94460.1 MAG: transcription elongation factor NusA [Candidatus Altiarchaeales archaeon]HDO82015.1 transcription elongation factor NusA [Candidatus Altiarchaeales archaeon]HEX54664.1 transcription elongation factor NusA [Candidatus Altiarchaeales archaeon]
MTLPICNICAKTGVLCSVCESKLESGKISELDVELSKILYKLGKGEIGFERAIDTKNFIVILTRKENVGKIIGKSGDNIRQLSKKFGKQIRVIGTDDLNEMIYDFVAPGRIISINTVYKPDGSVIQRVRINKRDRKKLRMGIDEIEKLISSLTNSNVEISFE